MLINSKGFAGEMSIEMGEKQFACAACDKKFSDQIGLQEHEESHFGKKIFKCNQCDKTFSKFSEIKEHERIHTETVTSKHEEKLLGLRINSSLDWKSHINYLCNTLKQRIALLKRIKLKVPTEALRIIAESIFNAKLRYGIAVYFKPRLKEGDESCTIQDPLQVLQNDMLRELFGHKRADRVNMEQLRKNKDMLSVNQLACYHILIETFNTVNIGF